MSAMSARASLSLYRLLLLLLFVLHSSLNTLIHVTLQGDTVQFVNPDYVLVLPVLVSVEEISSGSVPRGTVWAEGICC